MFGNAIGLTQMAFHLIPKIFNAIAVIMVIRKKLAMVNARVLKIRHIQSNVRTVIVSIDNTSRHHLLVDDGQKSLGSGARNHLRVDLAAPL